MKKLLRTLVFAALLAGVAACSEKDSLKPGDPSLKPVSGQRNWLELPAASKQDDCVGTYSVGRQRNYSYNYQRSSYTALWIAYPLYEDAASGSFKSRTWNKAPGIDANDQINIWDGSYNIEGEDYSRGHQIPRADRSGNELMEKQTYYAINSTPQIQNTFNGTIWQKLEDGMRSLLPATDTIYVVTGATFKTQGGNEEVKIVHAKHDLKKDLPVPNYYWKVLLKVKRSGKIVESANAIGFWFEHRSYAKNDSFTKFSCTVDEIEEKTGFNFFANVPESVQKIAESQNDWSAFSIF